MTPLGDAMRFVNDDGSDIPKRMTCEEQRVVQPLRSHVQEGDLPKPNVVQDAVTVVAHPCFGRNAPFSQGLTLIFHERYQGRQDQTQPSSCQSRKLKAQAFPPSSRQQRECMMPGMQVQHGPVLVFPKVVEAPVSSEQGPEILRDVKRRFLQSHEVVTEGLPNFGPQPTQQK